MTAKLHPPLGPQVEVTRTPSIDRARRDRVVAILKKILDSASTPDEDRRPR